MLLACAHDTRRKIRYSLYCYILRPTMQTLIINRKNLLRAICPAFCYTWTVYPTQPNCYHFCTQTFNNSDENVKDYKDKETITLCRRIEMLPRGESIGSAFQSWMGEGLPVQRADIFHTINRLRKRRFNKRALEVTMHLSLLSVMFTSNCL